MTTARTRLQQRDGHLKAVMFTAKELTGEEAKEVTRVKRTITFTTTSGKRYKAKVTRSKADDMFGTGYVYQVSAEEEA